jgi:hypothetical protein
MLRLIHRTHAIPIGVGLATTKFARGGKGAHRGLLTCDRLAGLQDRYAGTVAAFRRGGLRLLHDSRTACCQRHTVPLRHPHWLKDAQHGGPPSHGGHEGSKH